VNPRPAVYEVAFVTKTHRIRIDLPDFESACDAIASRRSSTHQTTGTAKGQARSLRIIPRCRVQSETDFNSRAETEGSTGCEVKIGHWMHFTMELRFSSELRLVPLCIEQVFHGK